MSDDKFSLGDILWEYADYTPPELETTAWVPLPPDTPEAPPAPVVQPGMPSPQPVSPPSAAPEGGKRLAPQTQGDQPLPANQVPVKAAPKEEPKPAAPAPPPAPPARERRAGGHSLYPRSHPGGTCLWGGRDSG